MQNVGSFWKTMVKVDHLVEEVLMQLMVLEVQAQLIGEYINLRSNLSKQFVE